MSVSGINYTELEKLRLFSSFFDLISNPEKYKSLIAEANAAVGRMEEVVTAYTSVKQAQPFLSKAAADAAKSAELLEQAKIKAKQIENDAISRAEKQDAEYSKKLSEVQELEHKLQKQSEAASKLQKELDELGASMRSRLDILEKRERELASYKADLDEKAIKIKQLLGA